MTLNTYAVSPIDNNWDFLPTVKDVAKRIAIAHAAHAVEHGMGSSPFVITVDEFLGKWEAAKVAASEKGWEGDFRNEPAVFMIPQDVDFLFGFVFKQENNGTTFVVSPVALHHLDEYF